MDTWSISNDFWLDLDLIHYVARNLRARGSVDQAAHFINQWFIKEQAKLLEINPTASAIDYIVHGPEILRHALAVKREYVDARTGPLRSGWYSAEAVANMEGRTLGNSLLSRIYYDARGLWVRHFGGELNPPPNDGGLARFRKHVLMVSLVSLTLATITLLIVSCLLTLAVALLLIQL